MDTSKFNNKKELRKFALYLGGFLFLAGLVQMFLGKSTYPYFYGASLLVLALGLAWPVAIKPIFMLLSYLGFYLGQVNSMIVLTIFFYLFITPVGFFLKLAGKDALHPAVKKEAKSYWILREGGGFEKKDFENQF